MLSSQQHLIKVEPSVFSVSSSAAGGEYFIDLNTDSKAMRKYEFNVRKLEESPSVQPAACNLQQENLFVPFANQLKRSQVKRTVRPMRRSCLQFGRLFAGQMQSRCGFAFFDQIGVSGLNKVDGFDITEAYALRLSIT